MLDWSGLKREDISADVISLMVKDYVMTSPLGDMSEHGIESASDPNDCEALRKAIESEIELGERFWGEPVVGFAHGDNPIFDFFKKDIGDFFWTPAEALKHGFPNSDFDSAGVTVVSWVLPQTDAAKKEQAAESLVPTLRWILTRKAGTDFMYTIGKYVCGILNGLGIECVVPVLTDGFSGQTSEKYGFASNWSERHVAYASGLGTFGLSDGLITSVGKAVRIGSIVINAKLDVEERPYTNRDEYCVYYLDGSCKACITRCPAGAITEAGHDKVKCDKYKQQNFVPYIKEKYGIKSATCGMCQTKVTCASRIPAKITDKKDRR
jgi:epoxyqueuosine reductase QueG